MPFLLLLGGGDFEALDPDVVVRSDHGTMREIRERALRQKLRSCSPILLVDSTSARQQRCWDSNVVSGGKIFALMCFAVKGKRIAEIDVIWTRSFCVGLIKQP
jgi:hypothetical protein